MQINFLLFAPAVARADCNDATPNSMQPVAVAQLGGLFKSQILMVAAMGEIWLAGFFFFGVLLIGKRFFVSCCLNTLTRIRQFTHQSTQVPFAIVLRPIFTDATHTHA